MTDHDDNQNQNPQPTEGGDFPTGESGSFDAMDQALAAGDAVEEDATLEAEEAEIEASIMDEGEFHAFVTEALIPMADGARALAMGGGLYGPFETLQHCSAEPTSRPATDALYRGMRSVPWLRDLLLGKESQFILDLAAIGAFGAALYTGCARELRDRATDAAAPAGPTPQLQPHAANVPPMSNVGQRNSTEVPQHG